jgi:uncharacterized membrane protein affecting hemolysin expression
MAASVRVTTKVNTMLVEQPDACLAAVTGKTTVKEAVEDAGIYDAPEITAEDAEETRRTLGRLSDEHNQRILDEVREALANGERVDVTWHGAGDTVSDVAVSRDANGRHIVLRSAG